MALNAKSVTRCRSSESIICDIYHRTNSCVEIDDQRISSKNTSNFIQIRKFLFLKFY